MSDGRLIFIIALAYGGLGFLGFAVTVDTVASAPAWQAPALYCVSAYLLWLAWDVLRGSIGL